MFFNDCEYFPAPPHLHLDPPHHIIVAAVPSPGRAAAALRPLVALLAEAQGDDKNENEP